MKPGGGVKKGNSNERIVSREFDVWWKVPKGTFRRTLHSGSWWKYCDVYSTNLRLTGHFPFVTECKFYKSYPLLKILAWDKQDRQDVLLGWWAQCIGQYEESLHDCKLSDPDASIDIYPLLIFTLNNYKHFAVIDDVNYNRLLLSKYCLRSVRDLESIEITLNRLEDSLHIFRFDQFTQFFGRTECK